MPHCSRIAHILSLFLLVGAVAPLALAAAPHRVGPVYDGPELDYQPSILRVEPNGQLLIVFERIRLSDFFGDLYVTTSDDEGATWTEPQAIIADPDLNERHPSLVQLGPEALALFYLTTEDGYRLHRATSPDGLTWTPDPSYLDLGWTVGGEINPCVIREADGSLTMTYHRLSGPSYIARSTDGGATWDRLMTPITTGSAPLPRLAKRESDGLYIVSYQVTAGTNAMNLYAKISDDPYDWNGSPIPISTGVDSHDSQPIVLEDGTLLVAYAKAPLAYYDLYYRTSRDGLTWSEALPVTDDPYHYDTQPHPLLHGTRGRLLLTWPHQDSSSPYVDHDVWIDTDWLVLPNLDGSHKAVAPAVVAAGAPLTYTLLLTNQALTTTAALTDSVPVSTTYQAGSLWASSGAAAYDPLSQAITWTGAISTDGEVTVSYRVATDAGLGDGTSITGSGRLADGCGAELVVTATALVDALPPSSAILDPLVGQFISSTSYLLSGTAADTLSGIAGIEVGVDSGPWQAAQGGQSWSWLWIGPPEGPHTLRSRATDGVGHIEAPGAGVTVTVDLTPPALGGVQPPDGALAVPLTATVVLTFSEPVLTGTLAYAATPNPGGWDLMWNAGATAAHLSHAPFEAGSVHTLTVTGVRDRARHLLPPMQWSFTTASRLRVIHLPLVLRGN